MARTPVARIWYYVSGNPVQLQQVLLNAIMNAMEAMSSNVPSQRSLKVMTRANGNQIEVVIVDCGPGVAPEHQARVFQPFFTTKQHSLGLGLSIYPRQLSPRMEENSVSKTMPAAARRSPSPCRSDATLEGCPCEQRYPLRHLSGGRRYGRVLKALTRMLSTQGYDVLAFSSPTEFLARHDRSVPGCAVFDVSMPGLDGIELQAALQAGGVERPVIFITGVGDIPMSVQAMKAGAVDFLTKPVKSRELLAAIAASAAKEAQALELRNELASINGRLSSLTPREREVLNHVVAGRLNKQIAGDLGIVEKTIKLHRGRMMRKMGVRTVADLVRIAERVGIRPSHPGVQAGG